jgi:ABC-type transporter Mla subunit MlaD
MRLLRTLKRMVHNSDATVQGIANQSDLLNRKLEAIFVGIANQSDLINRRLEVLVQILDKLRQIEKNRD